MMRAAFLVALHLVGVPLVLTLALWAVSTRSPEAAVTLAAVAVLWYGAQHRMST